MKKTNHVFLLVFLILFSCIEQDSLQPDDELEEAILDDSAAAPVSIDFSIERESNFETNSDISLQNRSQNLTDYVWDFGDGSVSTEQNSVTHSYAQPGKYTITLTGTTAAGEEMAYSKDLFVRKSGSSLDLLFISYLDSTLNIVDLETGIKTALYKVPYNPAGVLALDESENKVYYYDYSNGIIYKNSLSENNPVALLDGFPDVSDLEFDQSSGDLYIASSQLSLIFRYNPNTPVLEPAYAAVSGGNFGRVRDTDLKSGNIYTITPSQSYESVFRVDVVAGNVSQVINYQDGGYGYGVAFDDLNEKIYFNNVEEAALMKAEPDGSNIEKVIDLDRFGTVSFAGLCLTGLEVVETRNQLLWSSWEEGTLYMLNLETLQEETVVIEGLLGKFVPFENVGF